MAAKIQIVTYRHGDNPPRININFHLSSLFPLHQANTTDQQTLTGLDQVLAVKLLKQPRVLGLVDGTVRIATHLASSEEARDVWIGFSCSTGKHLSVAVATQVYRKLKPTMGNVHIAHRELPGKA